MLIVGIRIKSWKGRESNFPPFPWIQQLLLSNIQRASIAVYHLVMERVRLSGRRASKDWFGFYFEGESTSWLYHQLLDPPQIWFWRWVNFLVVSPVVGPTSPDSGRMRSPNRRFPRVATYIQQRSEEHKHSQDLVLIKNLQVISF